jgi:hypothetical protein
MKGEEKRRQIRVFTSVPVTFHTESSVGEQNGQMIDISLSGMRFTSREIIQVGDILRMRFTVGNDLRFVFIGRVVTASAGQEQKIYGVSFMKQTPADRLKLSEYIMSTRQEQEFWIKNKVSEKGEPK